MSKEMTTSELENAIDKRRIAKCCGRVWSDYRYYDCGKNAKIERDGKWYCKTHDPVSAAEKQAARNIVFAIKFGEQEKARDRKKAERECCDAVLADNFQLAIDLARYALGKSDSR